MKKIKRPALNRTVMRALDSASQLMVAELQSMSESDMDGANPCTPEWNRAIQYISDLRRWYNNKEKVRIGKAEAKKT